MSNKNNAATVGRVYVARRVSDGAIKVGFTSFSWEQRRRTHAAHGEEYDLLFERDGMTLTDEHRIHRRLSCHRMRARRSQREVYEADRGLFSLLERLLEHEH